MARGQSHMPPAGPWMKARLLTVATDRPVRAAGAGLPPAGPPQPWGVRFVSRPCLTASSGCSCVYNRVFISRSVLGCVTFRVSHQPVSQMPAAPG